MAPFWILLVLVCFGGVRAHTGSIDLPLAGEQVIYLHIGDRPHLMSTRLRWDFDYDAVLLGSSVSLQYTRLSATYDSVYETELFRWEDREFRLHCRLQADVGSRPDSVAVKPDHGLAEAVLPMGKNSPLWDYWHQYSVGRTHLTLGSYRRTDAVGELHVDGERFCVAVAVRGNKKQWRPYWMSVDLATDYTWVPQSIYDMLDVYTPQRQSNLLHNFSCSTASFTSADPSDANLLLHMQHSATARIRLALTNDNRVASRRWKLDKDASRPPFHVEHAHYSTPEQATSHCADTDVEHFRLGHIDALAHFDYGRDRLANKTSLSWHVYVQQRQHFNNNYVVLVLVMAFLLAQTMVVLRESAWCQLLDKLYEPYTNNTVGRAPTSADEQPAGDTHGWLLTLRNRDFRSWISLYIFVATVALTAVLVLGMRINYAAHCQLFGEHYVNGVVSVCALMAVLLSFSGPDFLNHYSMWATYSKTNALLYCWWLLFAADGLPFFNQVGMMLFSLLICINDCEMLVFLAYDVCLPAGRYTRRRWYWMGLAACRLAIGLFVLHGYTLPMTIVAHWPQHYAAPAFHLLAWVLVFHRACDTLVSHNYTVATEINRIDKLFLDARPLLVNPSGSAVPAPLVVDWGT